MSRCDRRLGERLRQAVVARLRPSPLDVERAEWRFYLQRLRPGMTVFDVGAHTGEVTLLFSKFVAAEGRVHAFKPAEAAFGRLGRVIGESGRRNVELNQLALSDHTGTAELNIYDESHASWASLARRPLGDYGIVDVTHTGVEVVPTTTVDDYCETQGIERVDLLKIDVEGAEFQVLNGARGMFEDRRIGACLFEFGQTTFDMGNEPDQIRRYCRSVNYRLRHVLRGRPAFGGRSAAQARFSMVVLSPA